MSERLKPARRVADGVADLVSAWHWLTRIPWPRAPAGKPRDLAAALWAFPLIGAVVGAVGGAVYWAITLGGASPQLAAVLGIGAMIVFTGALHEDGFADFCDGLGRRGRAADRILAMRDPRLGAFGAIGLALMLLARVEALSMVMGSRAIWIQAMAAATGRGAIGLVMLWGSPATGDGSGAAAGRAGTVSVLVGIALCGLLAMLGAGIQGHPIRIVAGLAGAILAGSLIVSVLAKRCFGGYTGDILGATSIVVETASLIILASALR